MAYRLLRKRRHNIDERRGDCVYLADTSSALKIGFSTNVAKRIEQLQTGCADKIELVRVWHDSRARKIERLAHRFLKWYRTDGQGEWFAVERDLAISVIDELFAQFPRNPANRPEPALLVICKSCGHYRIVRYSSVGRFKCSKCCEAYAIRFQAFPCQDQPEIEDADKSNSFEKCVAHA